MVLNLALFEPNSSKAPHLVGFLQLFEIGRCARAISCGKQFSALRAETRFPLFVKSARIWIWRNLQGLSSSDTGYRNATIGLESDIKHRPERERGESALDKRDKECRLWITASL